MRTALILGGGGSHGAIEVGVLKVLVKRKIMPSFVIGTSIGSINGAFYCENPTEEGVKNLENVWLRCAKVKNFFPLKKEILYKFGTAQSIYDDVNAKNLVYNDLKAKKFSDLKIKFYANCAQVESGKNVYFSKGDLKKAVLASTAVVPFLPPVKIGSKLYMDGGFSSYLGAVEANKLQYDKMIIVERPDTVMIKKPNGIHAYIYNSMQILTNQLKSHEMKILNTKKITIVEPKVRKRIGSIFDFKHTKYLIEAGEREAEKML